MGKWIVVDVATNPHTRKAQLYLILIKSYGKNTSSSLKGMGRSFRSFGQGEGCQGMRLQLPERAGELFVGKETQEAKFHEKTGMSTR